MMAWRAGPSCGTKVKVPRRRELRAWYYGCAALSVLGGLVAFGVCAVYGGVAGALLGLVGGLAVGAASGIRR
jgi:hypothetical protein